MKPPSRSSLSSKACKRREQAIRIEARLEDLGLVLPEPMQVSSCLRLPFAWVHMRGNRSYISGHIALNPDGSIAQPLGRVGAEVSVEEGYQPAHHVSLAHLASLKRAIGDLDRVSAWLRAFDMVNVAPGFNPDAAGHQRLLGPNSRTLRFRSRDARPLLHREDAPA
jgi:hypothetical protein